MKRVATPLTAYNLTVEEFGTFFVVANVDAAPVWVHNACKDVINFATNLGYKIDKGLGRPHGQDVFRKGNKFISRDADSHSGGKWKMFEMRGGKLVRIGTYNGDLSVRLGP